jgi:hypothetical protein
MLTLFRAAFMASVLAGLLPFAASAQDIYAAYDPNNDASSSIVWAPTRESAKKQATEQCRSVSKSCANSPASTGDMSHVFAVMCCSKPRHGCAASPAADRKQAREAVMDVFDKEGFSDCSLKKYLSAKTGEEE